MILFATATLALASQGTPSLNDVVQRNFKDATFTVRVLKANQSELRKINDDFGTNYRFEKTEVSVKEPFKLRIAAKVEDTNALMIVNGPMQLFSIPRIRLNQKQNLSEEPGRRQTALDFGLLTPSLFDDLFVAQFVRVDRATSDYVFDIKYHPRLKYRSYYRVWVDPQKKFVTKKEWYRRDRQLATFIYSEPKNEAGVWFPTRLSVKNVDNVVAGETRIDNLKINRGLSDDLFKIK